MERRQCVIFFLFSVTFFVFCELGACSTTEDDLTSCLTTAGVHNFTTIDDPTYGSLVSLSIKNLRFTTPPSVITQEPFVVILPEDTPQLASSIRCARAASYTIVLRSGGHSYEGFSSVSETSPFVVLDLMNLDRVAVDLETETAWVQGGATLGELYHAIGSSSKRYAFPAGMCPTVGVGGHFSGGGYGTLARKFGLSADNIVDAELVDGEGRVLDRNTMGEDVFWAIRGGGGGNWAAVADWKIKLLEIPETVTAFQVARTGSPAEMAKLWHKWQLFAAEVEDESFLMIQIASKNETHGPGVIVLNFVGVFLGPRESAFSSMASAFPELNVGSDDLKEMTWLESVTFTSVSDRVLQVSDLKNRFLYEKAFSKIKSDFVREPMTEDGIRGALEIIAEQPKAVLALNPYGGAMRRIVSDAIAFPHRAGNLYSIDYIVQWQEEGDTESDLCVRWLRRIYEYMTPYVSNEPRASYVNDVDLDLGTIDWNKLQGTSGVEATEIARAWAEKYFLGNYDRLVRAKTVIDPRNVFRHPQSIPPISILDAA
ncbi:hypothetical protein H6P81_009076 [Aristolochia fimbriata]|uniref:FAD-binding PCMH-type domain-containing protein n=1 Tax=Aristolochia fimbriata TaxID=158543 RepID=A0AAV7EMJ4_ARIFI|nr:hypothetical protein H6P81_009076 [Aristolochia fimbriata]